MTTHTSHFTDACIDYAMFKFATSMDARIAMMEEIVTLRAVKAGLLDALQLLLREEEAGTVCEIDRQTARAAIAKATGATA